MQSRLFFGIAVLIVVVGFIFFAFTATVQFSQRAVVATFGGAGEGSVRDEPGIFFRLPAPFQTVTTYDTRARLVQLTSETQQTADNRQVVVEAFLTWRVSDPLRFYQRFGGEGSEEATHFAAAERSLQSQLRAAMSEVSRFRMNELFNPQVGGSRLPELEDAIKSRLVAQEGEGATPAEWGVEPLIVGINRLILPEETTREVFERMKATQERLAAEAQFRGEAVADAIRESARADARRILAFAQNRAEQIRVRGDLEATPFVAELNADPELAVFLEGVRFMEDLYARRATLLISTEGMAGMRIFDPGVLGKLGARGLPELDTPTTGGGSEGDE